MDISTQELAETSLKMYTQSHPGRDAEAYIANFKAARPGISMEESTAVYDTWGAKYDEDLNEERYLGPKYVAEAAAECFPTDRENKLILDVACGTGLVAQWVLEKGFKKVHGLDASRGMLNVARQRNLFEKDFCCYLDDNPLPMQQDTYDCAVSSGGDGRGHIPTSGLRQLARVIKPGGLVIIAMREKYLEEVADYRGRLEQEMEDMEKDGVWTLQSRTIVPNYSFDNDGILFIFVVM